MKERPLILKDYAVRAVLAGLKTQDRRIVNPQPDRYHDGEPYWFVGGYRAWKFRGCDDVLRKGGNDLKCPYGEPGDKLWVRETFRLFNSSVECACYDDCRCASFHGKPVYRADGGDFDNKWKSSSCMPRIASRIDLQASNICVERLQDVSEEDAVNEGVERIRAWNLNFWKNYQFKTAHPKHGSTITDNEHRIEGYASAVDSFKSLWDSIHGTGSWDLNPLVWVARGLKKM